MALRYKTSTLVALHIPRRPVQPSREERGSPPGGCLQHPKTQMHGHESRDFGELLEDCSPGRCLRSIPGPRGRQIRSRGNKSPEATLWQAHWSYRPYKCSYEAKIRITLQPKWKEFACAEKVHTAILVHYRRERALIIRYSSLSATYVSLTFKPRCLLLLLLLRHSTKSSIAQEERLATSP